jgi:hypothetical protein
MASGRPSKRLHTATTTGALSAVSSKPLLATFARSTNKATGRIGHQRLQGLRRSLRRQRQRAQGISPLGIDPERSPAGGEDPELRAPGHQRGDVGGRRDHLFEVVEEQQGLLVPDQGDDALGLAPALCLFDGQRIGHGGDEVRGIGHGGQRDEGDPVEES